MTNYRVTLFGDYITDSDRHGYPIFGDTLVRDVVADSKEEAIKMVEREAGIDVDGGFMAGSRSAVDLDNPSPVEDERWSLDKFDLS